MSVNPAAVSVVASSATAAAAAAANVPVEQLIAAELNALAADAQALQSQLTTGQVVTAQVLPSNGLTDLINILGNRVAAALPPNLQVGDLFSATVTGFNGPQILLQVLSTADPTQVLEAPPPPGSAPAVPLPDEPLSALAEAAARPVMPDGVAPSLAPPPAVFVAASVRPAPANADGSPAGPAVTTPSSQVIVPPPTALADIEARLAAARAGQITVTAPVAPSANSAAPVQASPAGAGTNPGDLQLAPPPSAPPGTAAGAPPPPLVSGRFVIAPTIVPSARFSDVLQASPSPATPAAAPTGLAAFRDAASLVRGLGLPVTPTNIAAARMAIETPQRLPAALATLESALPELDDPRVTTLRALTGFLGRIDPGSPQLAAQISSFVDNVVTGNEPKLVQMLTAQLAAEQPAAAAAPPPPPAGVSGAQTAQPIVPEPALPVVALAQLAERGAALSVDLKTQLLAIINAPPPGTGGGDDLLPAASSALTAITAVQMNAAQAMSASPQTMAFTLPMWLGNGYAQARIAIDRDAPEQGGHRGLDGDNFHIAFVLDTKHLGTVTVDLQTVGRAFSLAVKAENETSAKRFGEALGRLTQRLETLRYRVNSAEAGVAPRGVAAAADAAATAGSAAVEADDGIQSDVNVKA